MKVREIRASVLASVVVTLHAGCAGEPVAEEEFEGVKPPLERKEAQLVAELFRADFGPDEDEQFLLDPACARNSTAGVNGTPGLRCEDASAARAIFSTAGYTNIAVSYSRRVSRYDTGEAFTLAVSYAGQTPEIVDRVAGTTSYQTTTVALGAAADNSQLMLVFGSNANGISEYFDLDQVVVTGTPINPADDNCNGVDDDNDGSIDEEFAAQPTTCGVGACAARGLRTCSGGTTVDSCRPGMPAASDATCDSIDDDCDGGVDENCQGLPVTLLSNDFESGLGSFVRDGACVISTAAANGGSNGLRCDDTASITTSFSTVGARSLTLSYARRIDGYDAGEYFVAEISVNGQDWTELERRTVPTSYATVTLPLPQFADQDDLHLRFRASANGTYERFDLDNVRITGVADASNVVRMLPSAPDFFAMPWPSDHRRNADGTLKLAGFPGMATARGGVGKAMLDVIQPNVRGFGTTTAAYFTMEGALDPRTLPAPTSYTDPRAPIMLVNLSNPAAGRVPVLVDMKGAPTIARPGRLLSVMPYPGFSLEPNTKYAVILFDNLTGRTAPVSRAPLLDQLASGDAAGTGLDAASFALLRDHKTQVDAYVQANTGHVPGDVVAFAVFTTQTLGREFTAAAAAIAALTDAEILTRLGNVRVVTACPTNCQSTSRPFCAAAKLQTTIQVPVYQTEANFAVDLACFEADGANCMSTSGGDFEIQDGRAMLQRWQTGVEMRILVPCLASRPAAGWPLLFFAEGTGGGFNAAEQTEAMYNRTPSSGPQAWLSLDHVVGSIPPYQSGDQRNDPRFEAQIRPFYDAVVSDAGVVGDIDGFTYAFEFNPVFVRTNHVQNAVDALYMQRVLRLLEQLATRSGLTPAAVGLTSGGFRVDPARTTLQGQSQGSHSAPLVLSLPPAQGGYHNAYLNASGGDLMFEWIAHRPDVRPVAERLFKLAPGEADRFHPIGHLLQTAKETGASINYSTRAAAPGHILITNGYQDSCSLREETSAVATAMVRANTIQVADTSAAFVAARLAVPPFLGVQTVLNRPLVPFTASGISGNLNGRTRLFLMLEGGHYGSRSGHAVANFLHGLGRGVVPNVIPPPYNDLDIPGPCNAPRTE